MCEESLIESKESSCAERYAKGIEHWSSCCSVLGEWENEFEVPTGTPMQQLEVFVDGYWYARSMRPLDHAKDFEVSFKFANVVITRRMITLLRPVLFCDEVSLSVDYNDNMDTLLCTANNPQSKFSDARIRDSCRFFSQADATTSDHDDDICTPDDKFCFLSAFALCTDDLVIKNCPGIVSDLLNMPGIDHMEAESLLFTQKTPLTDLEYVRLGSILENSVKIKDLSLTIHPANFPQAFCDSFANCIHVQSLLVNFIHQRTNAPTYLDALWSRMLAHDGNGPLERLLRNPQNQLKELDLSATNMKDHHVMAIAQLLPMTHIDQIILFDNNIHSPGLLEFARQLPNMHSLTKIYLGDNPWEESSLEVLEECGAALLHGLMQNPFIQLLDCIDHAPQRPRLWHYLSLNCAGRKILTSPSPFPDGLWPRVLSRAGRPIKERGRICIEIYDEDGNYKYNGPANAVYFFLRNLLSWQEKLSILRWDMLAS